jgi:hypothetical protein
VEPSTGKIYSFISKKFLRYYIINSGYACVKLQRKAYLVHRLVASLLDNEDNKPQVNHKDGNRLNNKLSNLEWITVKDNLEDALKRNPHLIKQKHDAAEKAKEINKIKIIMTDEKGNELFFNSLSDCSYYLNTRSENVSRWLNGIRNCSKGYTFRKYDIV